LTSPRFRTVIFAATTVPVIIVIITVVITSPTPTAWWTSNHIPIVVIIFNFGFCTFPYLISRPNIGDYLIIILIDADIFYFSVII